MTISIINMSQFAIIISSMLVVSYVANVQVATTHYHVNHALLSGIDLFMYCSQQHESIEVAGTLSPTHCKYHYKLQ